jgi:hypothetical protein
LIIATAGVTIQVLNVQENSFIAITSIIAIFSTAAYGGSRRNLVCGICIAAVLGSISYSWCLAVPLYFPSTGSFTALLTSS